MKDPLFFSMWVTHYNVFNLTSLEIATEKLSLTDIHNFQAYHTNNIVKLLSESW